MKRSQIYLKENQIKLLKKIAYEKNITMSDLVRDAIDEKYSGKNDQNKKSAGELLLELAKYSEKFHSDAPKDLSINLDKYLYHQ